MSTFGVLAAEKSQTLYVCSNGLSAIGVGAPAGKAVALKMFDLKTGAPKGGVDLLHRRSFCNDIAIGPDGAAYVTDSFNPKVLRLAAGAKAFEVWAADDRFAAKGAAGLDGIAFGADGALYVAMFSDAELFRIEVRSDGALGDVKQLEPSQPIGLPDAMRRYGADLLM